MVLDTSAIVAILLRESGFHGYVQAIGAVDRVFVGTPTVLEAGMVLRSRLGRDPRSALDEVLPTLPSRHPPVHCNARPDRHQRIPAIRPRPPPRPPELRRLHVLRHRICRRMPLLFKGDDFAKTDVARP